MRFVLFIQPNIIGQIWIKKKNSRENTAYKYLKLPESLDILL